MQRFSLYCHFQDIIDFQRHSAVGHVDVTPKALSRSTHPRQSISCSSTNQTNL